MKLQSLISSIRQPQTAEKTASEPAPATETKLAGALREATAAATSMKVASESASSPVADVMKVAAEIAGAEQEAAVKEAALLGAAFADAALSRFATWEKAAAQLPVPQQTKVASVAQQADETFAKYAEENPVLARQAIALGYAPTSGGLEKMAEDSYVQGYNDQVSEIHKTAQDEFLKAAAMTSLIIERAQGN